MSNPPFPSLHYTHIQTNVSLARRMTLDAVFGIADPLRAEVPEAIRACQRAGIVVRMITGDNLETACAIAREAGIMTDDGVAMEGEELRKLTPAELDEVLPRLQVVARSSPDDKNIIVQRLNGELLPKTQEEWEVRATRSEARPGGTNIIPCARRSCTPTATSSATRTSSCRATARSGRRAGRAA